MKKILALSIIVFISEIILVLSLVQHGRQDYCTCLGRHPYIHTKWASGRCVTLVLDRDDYFDGQSLVEYLYLAEEFCRDR